MTIPTTTRCASMCASHHLPTRRHNSPALPLRCDALHIGGQMFAKYRVAAAVIAAIAPCLCGSAAAREEVPYLFASDLAKYCAAADQTIDNALCVWFVMGALEVIVNNR